jgi:hypothetical protein
MLDQEDEASDPAASHSLRALSLAVLGQRLTVSTAKNSERVMPRSDSFFVFRFSRRRHITLSDFTAVTSATAHGHLCDDELRLE